jgi:hypothetical protein
MTALARLSRRPAEASLLLPPGRGRCRLRMHAAVSRHPCLDQEAHCRPLDPR